MKTEVDGFQFVGPIIDGTQRNQEEIPGDMVKFQVLGPARMTTTTPPPPPPSFY